MADTKGISVQVPVDLHAKVKAEQGDTPMNKYIQAILEEHFNLIEKGDKKMSDTRTLAFQVTEELFQRVKKYLSKHQNLTQKNFVIGLIEAEVDEFEALESRIASRLDARDGIQHAGGEEPPEAAEDGEETPEGAGDGEEPPEGAEDGEEPQEGAEDGEEPQEGAEDSGSREE